MPRPAPRASCSPFRGGTATARLQSHGGCARAERSSAREPPTPNPVTLESLCASSGCCPSGGWASSTLTSATCRLLGTPGPSFAPPSLVSSVRKGEIGAVTERLGEWAQSVGITTVPGMVGAGRHRRIRPPQFPSLCQAETQTPAKLKKLCTGPGH